MTRTMLGNMETEFINKKNIGKVFSFNNKKPCNTPVNCLKCKC